MKHKECGGGGGIIYKYWDILSVVWRCCYANPENKKRIIDKKRITFYFVSKLIYCMTEVINLLSYTNSIFYKKDTTQDNEI